ncbi:MAG TPA: undecaprenyl-phosphate glucose phosphotransferase [Kiritimatiellia bacterium]|nr:undecaprenyl-phosphate glucose phosphotransferase [Kiritimatiellia bacterium]HMP35742.1 undecaprenyl-phosphate glucose phosphotransferase [Kiritimatiellia bacterium]
MKRRDTFDVMCGLLGLLGDAVAVFFGFELAVWIRFHSGLIPMLHEGLPPAGLYTQAGLVVTLLFCFIYQTLGLYKRPQLGSFSERIPRLVRATGLGILLTTALAFAIRTDPPLSRITIAVALVSISTMVLVIRFILFRAELVMARRKHVSNRVIVIGTDAVAARLKKALEREPRLRTALVAYLTVGTEPPDPGIDPALIKGTVDDLNRFLDAGQVDQVILATPATLPHARMADIILDCERAMVAFNFVPDLFRLLTITMDIQSVDGIPILGTAKWPLDYFWNRFAKRTEDIVGALVGLLLSAPIILVAALLIKRSSPGPVFYRQERCGRKGDTFTIYKLRTMRPDAEDRTGPVWAVENDPRRTRIGTFLRSTNIDELPQFWNVLKGDMSLVGPRPERPHFVEQFKEDISRYMWRHFHRPGMTGWAQVNGLRGNTSIHERIKYDLYYLENWSLALDFKILARTFFTHTNAY